MRLNASVLVTDGEQRSALAAVRSLGRAGCAVHVTGRRTRTLAAASRYARSSAAVPDPMAEPGAYAEAVAEACRRRDVQVLLPMTDASLLALLPIRDRLGDVSVPFPSARIFRAVSEKDEVLRRAAVLGLSVPGQRAVEAPGAVPWTSEAELPLPAVLKPSRSVGEEKGERVRLRVRYAATAGELSRELAAFPEAAFPVLIQQRVVGPGIGIFLLLCEGELLGVFAHRRIREKPPSGGVSVYRESVRADPELVERSRRLLESFGWRGVAMVEYKLDATTGTPYLMEVNGRFWGSLQLAIDAGVDFPVLLVSAALGRRPAPVTDYRVGVRSRWWWGDVDQLLLRLRRSPDDLALPPGSPGCWRAVGEFMLPWRPGDRSEILRLSDPRPFLRESADWLRAASGGRR